MPSHRDTHGATSLIISTAEDWVGHVCVASAAFQTVLLFGQVVFKLQTSKRPRSQQGVLCKNTATILLVYVSSNGNVLSQHYTAVA